MAVRARIRAALLGILAIGLAACGGGDAGGGGATAATPYVIKFPHVVAPATPKGQMAQRFKELAEQRFPGRVRVEVYPSAQLMEDTESIEALAFGEIQMIAVSLSLFDRLTPKFQVFDLPFLFPNLPAVERFQASAAGRELLTTLTDRGIVGLAF
jgi:C4-dicarboxylate-binding protein DctP